MEEKDYKHLVELGRNAQEKINKYIHYADAMDKYVKQHSVVDPETDFVVMQMLLESHRKVILEIITIFEETERCINEYEFDIDIRINQLGLVHPFLERCKKDYELNMKVLSQILDKVE